MVEISFIRKILWKAHYKEGRRYQALLFHTWRMMEICISLKIWRNQCDRPPRRHWFVTFVSTGFVLTLYVTQMFDTRIRFTFFVRCCLFRFSCSAHGYLWRKLDGGWRKCVKGGASDARDAPGARQEISNWCRCCSRSSYARVYITISWIIMLRCSLRVCSEYLITDNNRANSHFLSN